MKLQLLRSNKRKLAVLSVYLKSVTVVCFLLIGQIAYSQIGTWTAITNLAPNENMGTMLLMTDGTVMCHNDSGGGEGTGWDKFTPDSTGSYANGTWSSGGSMAHDRLFFSSQVLPNGELWVAGGEYGSGDTAGELYNPITNTWSGCEKVPGAPDNIYDGNSEILPNGQVLVGPQIGTDPSYDCLYYSITTNNWVVAPTAPLDHDEVAWLKLPDSSILFVGIASTSSCRFEPKTNTWIMDASTPDSLYDQYGEEVGSAVLLPNGNAIFFGATGHNMIYTPTGTTTPGTWSKAVDFPFIGGSETGMVGSASCMEVNGNILCAVSPIGTSSSHEYHTPIYFVEYNYLTNTFAQVTNTFPGLGVDSIVGYSYQTSMLALPNGQVMLGINEGGTASKQYYLYTPGSPAIAAGKPSINSILPDGCPSYKLTGKLFNGISEGAQYGNDAQMSTNYPLVRLTNSAGNVYYCKTTDWNRIGSVMTDSAEDTTVFETPAMLPSGTYSLVVIANGFASNPTIFTTLKASANLSSAAYCGNTAGSASSTIAGGISPYTYMWADGETTSTVSGLGAGTYTLNVSDNNGCVSSASVTITQSLSFSYTVTATNVKCNGLNDGSILTTLTGGAMPYTYSWTGGETNSNLTGLSAGTYTLGLTDNSGCTTGSMVVIITQPFELAATANVTANVNCGSNNGSASSTVNGGTLPYTYSWTNGATTANLTGVGAGTYTLNVIDNSGCTASSMVTITQPSSIAATVSTTNLNCNGDTIGVTATATATGGITPYTYYWNPSGETTPTAVDLSAGTYTLSVTDNTGCSILTTAIITQPSSLYISAITTNNVTCRDGNNGTAIATATGGITPYTYSWNPSGETTPTATSLSSGIYTVNVTDNNGCTNTTFAIITQPSKSDSNLLCWATVDSLSLHNIISWDTAGTANESIDTVLLYFLNASNNWQKIGEEAYNDPNQYFVDSTSNPNAVTVRYCVRTMDSCGDTSGYSIWQNTMYISNIGGGTFSWSGTGYLIEYNSLPVLTYYLVRNDTIIDSVSGTQNKITDVNYSPTAKYFVGAKLSIPICTLPPTAMSHAKYLENTTYSLSHSNTVNNNSTGINTITNVSAIRIYPDPTNGYFTIDGVTQGQIIEMYNYMGQELNSETVTNNTTMHFDITNKPNGIYLIRILNADGTLATEKKMVKTQ